MARLAAIDTRIAIIDKELAANFRCYAALASPVPLSVDDVQKELGTDEALLLFLDTPEWKPTPEETFIWVVTKTDVHRPAFGQPKMAGAIRAPHRSCGTILRKGRKRSIIAANSAVVWAIPVQRAEVDALGG